MRGGGEEGARAGLAELGRGLGMWGWGHGQGLPREWRGCVQAQDFGVLPHWAQGMGFLSSFYAQTSLGVAPRMGMLGGEGEGDISHPLIQQS